MSIRSDASGQLCVNSPKISHPGIRLHAVIDLRQFPSELNQNRTVQSLIYKELILKL